MKVKFILDSLYQPPDFAIIEYHKMLQCDSDIDWGNYSNLIRILANTEQLKEYFSEYNYKTL